jgi:hypothetical protein
MKRTNDDWYCEGTRKLVLGFEREYCPAGLLYAIERLGLHVIAGAFAQYVRRRGYPQNTVESATWDLLFYAERLATKKGEDLYAAHDA